MDSVHHRETKNLGLLFNHISESCFNQCVTNFHQRAVDKEEDSCLSACVQKFLNVNHLTMLAYSELQPKIIEKRLAEAEAEAKKSAEQEEKTALVEEKTALVQEKTPAS